MDIDPPYRGGLNDMVIMSLCPRRDFLVDDMGCEFGYGLRWAGSLPPCSGQAGTPPLCLPAHKVLLNFFVTGSGWICRH